MDLKVRTTTYLNEDQSWLGSAHATDTGETVTLALSTFDMVTEFPNGFIPSGVPLGKVTASGEYGRYGASPNEQQTLTFDATGGVYTVAFDGSAATANITYANTAGDTATLLAALESLSTINPGDVVVTRGTPAGNVTIFTVEFTGRYAGQNVPTIAITETLTGGGATLVPAQSVAGGGAVVDGTETGVGLLLTQVQVASDNTTGKAMGSLVRHCIVREAKLPVTVDAAFKADVAGRIIFR